MSFQQSIEWLSRAKKVVPLASQTFSKCSTQLSVGAAPLFLDRAKGAHVWDIDGNEYVDQVLSLAPIVLGYGYDEVDNAVREQMQKGTILSLPGKLETEVAEKICSLIPGAEMVRYGKNGSDVTAGAIRVARAYTGRDIVAAGGYHGWQDWYIGSTTRNKGVPKATQELTKTFTYNNIESLEKIFAEYPGQVAAVILEPIGVEFPKDNFLQKVKDLTHKNGAVLIFDEMVTGFRIALGGAQAYFGVTADLACFGKAVANGYPISVLTGKRELMKECEEIFFSFTFGGELLSLAAALKTMTILERDRVNEKINAMGNKLQDGYNTLVHEFDLGQRTKALGYGSHHVITWKNEAGEDDLAAKTVFQEMMMSQGVLTICSNNTCFSHTENDIDRILGAYRVALSRVKEGIDSGKIESLIQGTKLQPVFRKP
ncbi:MAG: aminotransferase class III-fold pyridoxal phosphate-dependent enzyme [Candidatus Magasanikbacteria bacterium]|nr:aminotransferase class III-fold pyridoxal phosphate-dependent enzyme [Candidatus Magasanikbacteria bacterium]